MREFFTQRRMLGMWTITLTFMLLRGWLVTITETKSNGLFSHAVLVIPLTLISAYLLLSKPRQRRQKKLIESPRAAGNQTELSTPRSTST